MTLHASVRASRRHRLRGLSLIELLVALALGVVLVLGLSQVFASVRASFIAAEGIARLQENSRFAMEFLRRDLRMSSHLGCRSEYQLIDTGSVRGYYNHLATTSDANSVAGYDTVPYVFRLHDALEVYDYSAGGGTSPGNTFADTLAEFPAGVTAAANYTPALPAPLSTTGVGNLGTTGLLGNDVGDLVPGSDVIVVRYLSEQGLQLPEAVLASTGTFPDIDLPQWAVFGATNCAAVSLFQVTSSGPPAISQVDGTNNLNRYSWKQSGGFAGEPDYAAGTWVYRFEYALYHVGRTGNDTPPSLFRRRLREAPATANAALEFGPPEELVRGVEMMQVLLGVDNQPATSLDDQVDAYFSAAEYLPATLTRQQQFDALRRVKTLRVSLLMRSPDRMPTGAAPTTTTRTVGDVVVTPPADLRLRQVYDTTIALRNRVRN